EKMAEGDARGRVELAEDRGREQGREEGLEKGREEGLISGLNRSIVGLWERRLGPMPDDTRRRLDALKDPQQLEEIFDKVFGAGSTDDVDL
ncbi:MAG: hypothetical protein GY856_44775, partial [bacterium]|nr:hypothetical protein [bacterium]